MSFISTFSFLFSFHSIRQHAPRRLHWILILFLLLLPLVVLLSTCVPSYALTSSLSRCDTFRSCVTKCPISLLPLRHQFTFEPRWQSTNQSWMGDSHLLNSSRFIRLTDRPSQTRLKPESRSCLGLDSVLSPESPFRQIHKWCGDSSCAI